MIKIYKSDKSRHIFIEGVSWGSFDDMGYQRNGNSFSLDRNSDGIFEVANVDFSEFIDAEDNGFASADDFETYLQNILTDEYIVTSSTPTETDNFLTEETITSLLIVGNELRYTDENGNTTNIDLSIYIDDTNLARLVSGTLDASTGVVTFTRDDSSTFDVDFSALISGMQSLDNLSDVDTSNVTKIANKTLLIRNSTNDGWEAWNPTFAYQDEMQANNRLNQTTVGLINQQSNTYENFLTVNVTPETSGVHVVTLSYKWSINTTTTDFLSRLNVVGDSVAGDYDLQTIESKDSAGTGETLNVLAGGLIIGNANTGTNQCMWDAHVFAFELVAGVSYTFNLQWGSQSVSQEAAMYKGLLMIEQKTKS